MIEDQTYFDSEGFQKSVSDLAQKAGMPTSFTLKPLAGGRNNRVFLITYDDDKKLLLKVYFQHPNDPRNRVKAEYSFLNFAWNNNVRCIPHPYAADFQNNLALYGFIEGGKLSSSEINEEKIKKALNFFIDINKYKNLNGAKNLPLASEACFCIRDHLNLVEKRIEKLKKINNFSEINHKAISFIKNGLSKEWEKTMEFVNKLVDKYNLNIHEHMPIEERCISPSDFGFHNTLLKEPYKLYFIDFEYSGWDDPAKMVCDFFCQPEVKVPFKYFDLFVKTVSKNTLNHQRFRHRVDILLPVYKIKWCCILLNEFLKVESERRNFAYGTSNLQQQKIRQLEKARKYLGNMEF